MSKKIAPWLYPWPPNYDEFTDPMDGKTTYSHIRAVWAWLRLSPEYQSISTRELNDIGRTVYQLDEIAALAAIKLVGTTWAEEELRHADPPNGVFGRQEKKWRQARENQKCIDYCLAAREAIYLAQWSDAIRAAISGGIYYQGDIALIGRSVFTSKAREKQLPRNIARDRNYRAEALQHRKNKPDVSSTAIACWIFSDHQKDDDCPSIRTIRRIISVE